MGTADVNHRQNEPEIVRAMTKNAGSSDSGAHSAIVHIGKMKFVVNERFAQGGKRIDELMEDLAVDKYRKTS